MLVGRQKIMFKIMMASVSGKHTPEIRGRFDKWIAWYKGLSVNQPTDCPMPQEGMTDDQIVDYKELRASMLVWVVCDSVSLITCGGTHALIISPPQSH
jgi:hypothetical protein